MRSHNTRAAAIKRCSSQILKVSSSIADRRLLLLSIKTETISMPIFWYQLKVSLTPTPDTPQNVQCKILHWYKWLVYLLFLQLYVKHLKISLSFSNFFHSKECFCQFISIGCSLVCFLIGGKKTGFRFFFFSPDRFIVFQSQSLAETSRSLTFKFSISSHTWTVQANKSLNPLLLYICWLDNSQLVPTDSRLFYSIFNLVSSTAHKFLNVCLCAQVRSWTTKRASLWRRFWRESSLKW